MHKLRTKSLNIVIIKLKPRPYCSSLKTFPSFTGRWTISHWALNDQSPGGERSVTGRWTMGHWAVNDGKMKICERKDAHLWTERRTSTNGNTKVSGFSILRCLARDSYTSTRRSRTLYESVPPQHLQALNFVIHSVCAIFACTFLRGFYP